MTIQSLYKDHLSIFSTVTFVILINTELIPISTDESFRIVYSLTRDMEIEFYKTNKVVVRQQCANEFEAQRSLSE